MASRNLDTASVMLPCPLCSGDAHPLTMPFDGYIEGYRLSIYGCASCHASFSSRLDVPTWLYDAIYENAIDIPGYNRYDRYLKDLVDHAEPLDYLAEADPPYWHVRQFMFSEGISKNASIVELGCGTGYLTYALRCAGYACIGVDLSDVAIARAREIFGHPEWFMTTEEFSSSAASADLVIALELVEHVPDPRGFVATAMAMIRPEGAVLMSTPNRDARPRHAIWASDPPPVHLFWLGRDSFRAIGAACKAQVVFPGSTGAPVGIGDVSCRTESEMWPPMFTADGKLSSPVRRSRGLRSRGMARLGRLLCWAANRIDPPFLRTLPPIKNAEAEGETLAVVLRHAASPAHLGRSE